MRLAREVVRWFDPSTGNLRHTLSVLYALDNVRDLGVQLPGCPEFGPPRTIVSADKQTDRKLTSDLVQTPGPG